MRPWWWVVSIGNSTPCTKGDRLISPGHQRRQRNEFFATKTDSRKRPINRTTCWHAGQDTSFTHRSSSFALVTASARLNSASSIQPSCSLCVFAAAATKFFCQLSSGILTGCTGGKWGICKKITFMHETGIPEIQDTAQIGCGQWRCLPFEPLPSHCSPIDDVIRWTRSWAAGKVLLAGACFWASFRFTLSTQAAHTFLCTLFVISSSRQARTLRERDPIAVSPQAVSYCADPPLGRHRDEFCPAALYMPPRFGNAHTATLPNIHLSHHAWGTPPLNWSVPQLSSALRP